AVYVNDLGDVGIGTTNPANRLHVRSANGTGLLVDHVETAGYIAQVWTAAEGHANESGAQLVAYPTDDATFPGRVRFGGRTASTDLEFILGSGNYLFTEGKVGIGTTGPAKQLDVSLDS